MVVHTLDTQFFVPRTRDELFPFFCDAFNLERITPPELKFRVLRPRPIELREGARIEYRLRLWGVPFGWRTLISLWEPPVRFVDEQTSGPFGRWVHRHEFVPTGQGTIIRDHVDYALPLSPLSGFAHPLMRRQLTRIFRYRHQILHAMFCAEPFAPVPIDFDGPAAAGNTVNP